MLEHYTDIVRDKYIRRRMIQAARDIAALAKEEDGELDKQASEAQQLVFAATEAEFSGSFKHLGEVASAFWEHAYSHREEGASGVTTGFGGLDIATGGFQPGDVVVLAARPGQGKTTLAMQIAHHTAKRGLPVALLQPGDERPANRQPPPGGTGQVQQPGHQAAFPHTYGVGRRQKPDLQTQGPAPSSSTTRPASPPPR